MASCCASSSVGASGARRSRKPAPAASLLIILIGLIALWQLPGLLPSRLNRFTVLVAPFNERDGALGQTGSVVADQLVALLNSTGRVRAQRVARAADRSQRRRWR